jgi:mannose-6-phosphate isomerase-like protein (cupin superfamily)
MSEHATNARTIYNPVQRDTVEFLETSAETNGRHTRVAVTLAPGGGVALHYHKTYAEHFACLEGVLSVQIAQETVHLQPGQQATAAAGVIHRFFNATTAECRFECLIAPGRPGFEQVLQIGYGLARDGKTDKSGRPKSLVITAWLLLVSEMQLPGWYTLLERGLLWLARRRATQRVGQELIARYVRL